MRPQHSIPESQLRAEGVLRDMFLREATLVPEGDRVARCLQCGCCTGSCPVSYAMDISPRMVVALFRAGEIAEILESRTVWLCASCYLCTTRCPQRIRLTDLLYALKRTALEAGIFPARFPVYQLSETFTWLVRRYGRSHELLLLLRYGARRDPWSLVRMAPLGLTLWRRGRLALLPRRIHGIAAVRQLLDAAKEMRVAPLAAASGHTAAAGCCPPDRAEVPTPA